MIKYDIDNDEFREVLATADSEIDEDGKGVYYTQINDSTLFTIYKDGEHIHVYDLKSSSCRELNTTIQTPVDDKACIASSESPFPILYIVGGYGGEEVGALTDLQILNLHNMSWNTGPSMLHGRKSHGCVVVMDNLWATGHVAEVEAINITDIYNQGWTQMTELPLRMKWFGLVVVDEFIGIIGGYDRDAPFDQYLSSIFFIDTYNSLVYFVNDSIISPAAWISATVVGRTIYGFGGYDSNDLYHDEVWLLSFGNSLSDILFVFAKQLDFCKLSFVH